MYREVEVGTGSMEDTLRSREIGDIFQVQSIPHGWQCPWWVVLTVLLVSSGLLPVEVNAKIEFAINLKTAKALGLTIAPEVLFQADRIIR